MVYPHLRDSNTSWSSSRGFIATYMDAIVRVILLHNIIPQEIVRRKLPLRRLAITWEKSYEYIVAK